MNTKINQLKIAIIGLGYVGLPLALEFAKKKIVIGFDVEKPGAPDELVPFADLSVSGRVVNAYNALLMADRMINGK